MQTFYKLERTMKKEYEKAQKSVDFFNKAMKLNKYRANAKNFKDKILDKGLNEEPPFNLLLNEIATTLDAENMQDDNTNNNTVVHGLTRLGTRFQQEKEAPPPRMEHQPTRQFFCQNNNNTYHKPRNKPPPEQSPNLPRPLVPPQNNKSFIFKPTK